MHIYIDESGSFIIPPWPKSKVCCVGALGIPPSDSDSVLNEFLLVRSGWNQVKQEIKGSSLSEKEIAQVISLLNRYDVVLEICGVDNGLHTESQVTEYKQTYAAKLTETLTPSHHPNVIEEVHGFKDSLLKLSNQLFLQFLTTHSLIRRMLETSTLYYSQRRPEELGEFHWLVDRKDKSVTSYESLWTKLILPMLANSGPLMLLETGDYSHFDRFTRTFEVVPEHLRQPWGGAGPTEMTDIKMIMGEHFSFGESQRELGLQLVDILASVFTRALNGTLKESGWEMIGSLMVQRLPVAPRMISLGTVRQPKDNGFRRYVLETITERAKPMLSETTLA